MNLSPMPFHLNARLLAGILFVAAACLTGCAGYNHCIVPVTNQDYYALSSDDVAIIMNQAGFNEEQILELGPGLRDALARQGAAQFQIDHEIDALFAVHHPYVHVSSRRRGSFSYNIETHQIR